jgi:selenocysteine lyase/cysteine desulfurase
MPGRVARELAERGGIGVRYGCHCAHMLIKRLVNVPPLLEQLQGLMLTLLPRLSLPGVVRVSLGIENSAEDVDTLIHVLGEIASTHHGTRTTSRVDVHQQMDEFVRAASLRVYAQLR